MIVYNVKDRNKPGSIELDVLYIQVNSFSPENFMKVLINHEYLLAKKPQKSFKLHNLAAEQRKMFHHGAHIGKKFTLIRQLL